MIGAFSFPVSPERGRLRGWLEGSLAGLCELHWLRERQEYRVQQALRLAQPGMGGAEAEDEEDAEEDEDAAAARRAAAALEEQLVRGRLSVRFYEDPSCTGGPDSPPSTFCGDSGFSGSGSYGRLGPSEPRGIYASERPKSLGDASPSAPEAVGARAAVPRSYSAPYPTAGGSAGAEACSSAERRQRAGPFLTTRGLPGRAARRKAPPLTRGRSVEQSPPRERPRAAGRRGRMTEASGRRGSPRARKTARSQSETSLLGRAAAVPPGPPKYPTAEREEPRPPRPRRGPAPTLAAQAAGACRRWRSTAEIDAADGRRGRPRAPAARGPGPGPSPSAPQRRLLYGCAGSDSECSAGRLGPIGRRGPTGGGGGYGESESSASEGESPAFSSASSDSDGSGGLVWPQQLVAATAASGPGGGAGGGAPAGPAKVFVKIKASHALKKKILRFRSGSLKVMTTV
ncbi:dapper homolog 3 [Orycteropus afer afer]|uniref:Dapper homolog 3 n=1 Tax=Orycteropus afer afer TaxID=1230840 RepID=A0A8B7A4Z9_ORYAF|nr:dapper homolog 3 [Orycteropus afer afer]